MNAKKDSILQTALAMFYRDGIHAVGINEILKQAGVAKKTLYHHYPSKDALLLDALAYRDATFQRWLVGRMSEHARGLPSLLALFDALDDWFNDNVEELGAFQGCFFVNTCAEFSNPDCEIYKACRRHKQAIEEMIADQLSEIVVSEPQRGALTAIIATLKEGAISRAFLCGDKNAAKYAKSALPALLDEYKLDDYK